MYVAFHLKVYYRKHRFSKLGANYHEELVNLDIVNSNLPSLYILSVLATRIT